MMRQGPLIDHTLALESRPLLTLLAEQRQILPVPLCREVLHRDEAERRRVDAVALATLVLGAIVEDVAEVGIAVFGTHLRARHAERAVGAVHHARARQRLREARP